MTRSGATHAPDARLRRPAEAPRRPPARGVVSPASRFTVASGFTVSRPFAWRETGKNGKPLFSPIPARFQPEKTEVSQPFAPGFAP
jgi:hypothetical protein